MKNLKRKTDKAPLHTISIVCFSYKPACLQINFHGRLLSIRVFSADGHYGLIVESLSKGVFERRTGTGNDTFPLFTRLGATTFVILSVVTRIEMIYLNIRAHPLSKNEKRPLPVAVRRSKTPLLKAP